MNQVYVVIQIDHSGGSKVDCVCKHASDAMRRVDALKQSGLVVHAVTYAVAFYGGEQSSKKGAK